MKQLIRILLCGILFILFTVAFSYKLEPKQDYVLTNHYDKSTRIEPITLSFAAVGDNLIHGAVYHDAYIGNNQYDFVPYYEEVKEFIQNVDISFINQETIIGGKEIGLSHYPLFNSPEEVAEAIYKTGFDLVNTASNHSLDKGEKGVLNALNTFSNYPSLSVAGINSSFEEQQQVRIQERNGIKIGFLAYTNSTNGINSPKGKEYLVNRLSEEQLKKDIPLAKEQCDILLVSMHWGTEDSHNVNSMQEKYASLLNQLGVDVIIGTHPHVIQKTEVIHGENQDTLVMYSLGNFLSAQAQVKQMLELMVYWEIDYQPLTKELTLKNIKNIPLINHFDKGYRNFKIYPLKDYTETLASKHGLTFTKEEMIVKSKEILGNEIELVIE